MTASTSLSKKMISRLRRASRRRSGVVGIYARSVLVRAVSKELGMCRLMPATLRLQVTVIVSLFRHPGFDIADIAAIVLLLVSHSYLLLSF